ncbi:amphi-Trp domain-containing protein [Halegenticoccus tardaugens]|uniref:amphi-Trp domain-containing protein n=1 Tax=Halegenticoccus tardaugens TaxID=2071624 RepID=UPI00100AA02A|nr:amphi-Trp domain-containing protein [Halegenticoccus tardaugens]
MSDKTITEEKLAREEAAERLERLAAALRDGDDGCDVRVGNKTVRLHPPKRVNVEVGVRERSSILRGSRESVTVTIDWKPK